MSLTNPRRTLTLAAVFCLAGILVAELALSIRQQSQTFDEGIHLLAGYGYWLRQDFGVNPEHPPLGKWVASLPLLILKPALPMPRTPWVGFTDGWQFLQADDVDGLLFASRMAASLFTVLLALLVFEAAYEMFGGGPAFLALTLLVFEPNLLANGALVTTDMAVTCSMFAAVYAFYRYTRQPTPLRLAAAGFSTGMTLAAKHSGVLIIPILLALTLVELWLWWRARRAGAEAPPQKPESLLRHATRLAVAVFAVVLIAGGVLWGFYGFRFSARPSPFKMEPPLAESLKWVKNRTASKAIALAADAHLLPESYLYGMSFVLIGEERSAYILGKVYPRGQWFYFPLALLVKSTLGFLLLLGLAAAVAKPLLQKWSREVLYLLVPAALFFGVSLTAKINIGLRHILPIYPFLLILAGAAAWVVVERKRTWAWVWGAVIFFHGVSSLRAYPNYLPYSNELWGGPGKTHKVFADPNVDWGQGLKAVKRYLDDHPTSDCWLAYCGTVSPRHYNIPCRILPTTSGGILSSTIETVPETIQGSLIIGISEMSGLGYGPAELNPYGQFLRAKPQTDIAGCMLVYKGRFDVRLLAAMTHSWKAWEFFQGGKLESALGEAQRALALQPHDPRPYLLLGKIYKQRKQTAEARQAYQKAIALARSMGPEYFPYLFEYAQKELDGL